NRNLHKIIFSQKQVMRDMDFQALIKNLKIGQKVDAIVSNVAPFGIFLSIPIDGGKVVEGFVHISEISWENVPNISDVFKIGDRVTALVLGFDKESRRTNASVKRLKENPLEKKLGEYTIDRKLTASVIKIVSTGVLMELPDNITGFVKKTKFRHLCLIKKARRLMF
ncbi:MAG: S1 RNA-binding domain-containing protein, partial [Patescibacteria group bacterium]